MTIHLPDGTAHEVPPAPPVAERLTMRELKKRHRKERRAKERASTKQVPNVFTRASFSWWGGAKKVRQLIHFDRMRRR